MASSSRFSTATIGAFALTLCVATDAASQTVGWTHSPGPSPLSPNTTAVISAYDMDTLTVLRRFTTPASLCIGGHAMSADRRHYFLVTGAGLARFDTRTREFVELITDVKLCNHEVVLSPDDRRWHLFASDLSGVTPAYRIVDAFTRTVLYQETGSLVRALAFSADATLRFELRRVSGFQHVCRALREPTNEELWRTSIETVGSRLVATPSGIFVRSGNSTVTRLHPSTGVESGRVDITKWWPTATLVDLVAAQGRLLIAATSFGSTALNRHVGAFDLDTLEMIEDVTGQDTSTPGGAIVLRPDGQSGFLYYTYMFMPRMRTLQTKPLQLGTERAGFTLFTPEIEENRVPTPPTLSLIDSSQSRVRLSWAPATSGTTATGFVIRGRRRGTSAFSEQAVAAAAREWLSDVLATGAWEFEVVARNAGGASPPSNRVAVSVGESIVPGPPQTLHAAVRDAAVQLFWLPPADAAISRYVIEAAVGSSGAFFPLTEVPTVEYSIGGVPPGTWRVRVRARTEGAIGDPSNVLTITTTACSVAPPAPTSLSATTVAGVVTLSWLTPEAAIGADEFIIEATTAPNGDAWQQVASAGLSNTFQSPAPTGWYLVRVRARNACGPSNPSNHVMIVTP